MKRVTALLLEALENTEPIVDRQSHVYTTFHDTTWMHWMGRMEKRKDADAVRWYFHRLRGAFRLVRDELYGTISNADAATGGNTNDEDDGGDESAAGEESDSHMVGYSEFPVSTGLDSSTRTERASTDIVTKSSSVQPTTKSRPELHAQTARSSQRRDSDDSEVLREHYQETMHYSPRREEGDGLRGEAVDPKKAHLPIGERELSDYDAGNREIERLRYIRKQIEDTVDEDKDMDMD
jgi:hypothetical protein